MQVSSRVRPHHLYVAEMFRYHASVLKQYIGRPEFKDRFMLAKGNVANDLFRSSVEVQTGLITEEALSRLLSTEKYSPTKEHVMSRNRSAEHILNRLLKYETSDARLLNMIITSCRTVFSTDVENRLLEKDRRARQQTTKRCILPWRSMYVKLNLQPSPRKQRAKAPMVEIEGEVYQNAAVAAESLNMEVSKVRAYCRSTAEKWIYWQEISE